MLFPTCRHVQDVGSCRCVVHDAEPVDADRVKVVTEKHDDAERWAFLDHDSSESNLIVYD
ncbi:MAG: hypothetical protein LKI88_03555 [Bifidobacterium sp.]|nr:hypothetical protein [Bifidobacterium sp.]